MTSPTTSLRTVPLAAGGTHVEIVPELGGRIARLELGGREWLWTSDRPRRAAPTGADAADDDLSYVRTADAGGWDECLPTVAACRLPPDVAGFGGLALPDHGELWTQEATTARVSERGAPAAITRWKGRRMPYALVRSVRVDDDGRVHLHYALTNEGELALPFLWSALPLLPLIPDTRLELPIASRVRVWAQHGIELGGELAEHRWPMLRVGGREVDFTHPGRVRGAWACKLFLDLPQPQPHAPLRIAVEQERTRLVFEMEPRDVPNVGLWLNHGGWTPFADGAPYVNLAFAPCIGAPDALDAALGPWRGAHWLPRHETRRWGIVLRATR